MTDTPLRKLIDGTGTGVGTMLFEMFVPGIGHILKNAGCDFGIIDMEHSGLDFSELKAVIRYFEAAGLSPVVRVPTSRSDHLARALDVGAEAVMVPMVSSAGEARRIVDAVKFHPQGGRGIAMQIGHDRYAAVPLRDNLDGSNRRTTIFVQIETAEGVTNARDIAAVPGVDCLWIGHGDLSASLGSPGDFTTEAYRSAFAAVVAAAKEADTALGKLVMSSEEGRERMSEGFRLICYTADVKLLYGALKSGLDALREGSESRS